MTVIQKYEKTQNSPEKSQRFHTKHNKYRHLQAIPK